MHHANMILFNLFTNYPSENLRNYKGVTQARQNMIDAKRIEYLLARFPDYISKVEVIWECEWTLVKQKSLASWPALKAALDKFYEIDGIRKFYKTVFDRYLFHSNKIHGR